MRARIASDHSKKIPVHDSDHFCKYLSMRPWKEAPRTQTNQERLRNQVLQNGVVNVYSPGGF